MDVNRVAYPAPPPPVSVTTETVPVEQESVPSIDEAELTRAIERSEVKLERAVAELNKSLATYARHMSINLHEATNRVMVKVYNSETREVIREIPPERVLDAHASLMEMAGLILDKKG
ncbi:MAG: flagellar protein FlaG [Defluviitaleaceae bacterium]|nr:flagellar protein FlaG [Defluviitaleaceae bacterium]